MYFIEGHWETIYTLNDVSRIIREYYNRELADILDNLIEEQEYEIQELRDDISYFMNSNDEEYE